MINAAIAAALILLTAACNAPQPRISLTDKIDNRFIATQDTQRLDTLIDLLVSQGTIQEAESWQMKAFFHGHPEAVPGEWTYESLRKRATEHFRLAEGTGLGVEILEFRMDTSSALGWRETDFHFAFRLQNLLPDTIWEASVWLILKDSTGKELFFTLPHQIAGPVPPMAWSEVVTDQETESSEPGPGEKPGDFARRSASEVRRLAVLIQAQKGLDWHLMPFVARVGKSNDVDSYGYHPMEVEHGR